MNVRDSEAVGAMLEAAGHVKAEGEDDADLVIVNSCTVRQKAEEGRRQMREPVRREGASADCRTDGMRREASWRRSVQEAAEA